MDKRTRTDKNTLSIVAVIIIKEVKTSKDLDSFIQFNYDLYRNNKYAVPDLYSDLKKTLTQANPAMEFCERKLFLAIKNGKVVGRVAAIINKRANKTWNLQTVRFGWIDFIDDIDVSRALLQAVEDFGRKHGMKDIQGPLGFTDMDAEGMLIEGFEELGTMATIYNYPYYQKHMETLGFEKATDWIEMLMTVPDKTPDRLVRIAQLVKAKYNLQIKKYKKAKDLERAYGQEIFQVINEAFKPLYGYSEMTPRQIDNYVKQYLGFIDPKLVSLIADENDRLIGVGIAMPSLSRALQKSGGKLFPTGWWPLLKALKWKHSDTIDLMLVAVLPDWQNKGVNALFFYDLLPYFISGGYKHVETNVELEDNQKVQQQWIYFERRQHKRRRCWKKNL